MIEVLVILAVSMFCGMLYRMGGSKYWDTLYRDLGCSLCMSFVLFFIFPHNTIFYIGLVVSTGIMFAALTTYRYFLPKPAEYNFWYFGLHGFMVALAAWPVTMTHPYESLVRCLVCWALVGGWSQLIGKDVWEEAGRGFILCFSLAIFLL